ncbi:amino acid adenylation domain-containing protein, partial [Pseudoalteromonas sp. SMS1]|uniref:non-ribosomal peptide synthetase n=1 Tax=Pseudoalteromonas sp. SMS1 TaxID=2908894 RepID=UPI001F305167
MKEIRLLLATLNQKGVKLFLEQGKLKSQSPKGAISDDERAYIKQNKQHIIEYLETFEKRSTDNVELNITKQNLTSGPLSFSQQRLWFLDQLQGSTPEYNMPVAFQVQGQLDIGLLNRVFSHIIARHEVLRSVYTQVQGEASQHILEMSEVNFAIDQQDFRDLTGEAQAQAVASHVKADMVKPFDLAKDIMLRVSYFQTADAQGVLLFNMHHIVSDGWSMDVLTKEFFTLFEAFSQGKSDPLEELAIQYSDYAHWQRSHLDGEVLDSQLNFWESQLEDIAPLHSLPLSKPRPQSKQHLGAVVQGELGAAVGQQLQSLAKKHNLTPFMLLHGALSLLLARHSNAHDIVIGTPVANRRQHVLTPLIGFFVNTLVLRTDTNQPTLADYFTHIRKVHLEAQANQDVPFEQLVERLKIPRNTAHTPLFQIMMTTETDYGVGTETDIETVKLSDLTFSPYQSQAIQAKFDLNVDMKISELGVGINWTYDISLFDEQAIVRLNEHLCRLLTEMSTLADETVAPHSLSILSEAEQHHLINELNDTTQEYPKDLCLQSLFEQQAQDNPDKVAIEFGTEQLTYQALNEQANQLAHYLIETQGVGPDTLVGLCFERSLEMVIGILGILKSGGAYVPLDPNYPQSRLDYMINDAALTTIVSHSSVRDQLTAFSGQIIDLDSTPYHDYCATNITQSDINLKPSNLAYVIYTSGSTGQPKGVLTPHLAVVRLVNNQRFMTLDADTCMMQCANIAFDAATLELWGPLLNGGKVVLYSAGQLSPELLNNEIIQHSVNTLWLTAGFFREWSHQIPENLPLKQLLAGGDVLDPEAIQRTQTQLPDVQLINGYGPTENTTFSTTYAFKPGHNGVAPIGKPLMSDSAYVLDCYGQLVAKGVIGELYIGGDGLARGYLNRPELTQARFIANPFYNAQNPHSPTKLYRTGDLVRYLPGGDIEFIGRADDQVKIRGFRIELGEIESQLSALNSVDSSLILTKKLADNQQLVGYIKPVEACNDADKANFVNDVKIALSSQLPEYMVPSVLMVVDDWPLTPNGKVDKKALPEPDGTSLQGEYVAPANDTEQVLVEIWSSLLDLDSAKISTQANFFELGGHSILSIRLVSSIRTHFAVELPIQTVFDAQTLADLSVAIENHADSQLRAPLERIARTED